MGSTSTCEQEQAAWDKYFEESETGKNMRVVYCTLNIAERDTYIFVKDVAVGEEIFSSQRIQLLSNVMVQYQADILTCQNHFITKHNNYEELDPLVLQQIWNTVIEPHLVFEVARDTYKVVGVCFHNGKTFFYREEKTKKYYSK